MHTKLILEAKRMFKPDELKHFIGALQSIADASDFVLSVEELPPKRMVKIVSDEGDREHIRKEYAYAGTLFIAPNRYFSGDEGADDPVFVGCKHCRETIDYCNCDEYEEERRLRDDIAVCLPVYAYVHGGVTVSHGAFNDPWDSGCAGAHYMTKETVDREFDGDIEAATKCLEAELWEFDQWLRGNVWGYEVRDEDGEVIDSCYGFIGDELDSTGIADHLGDEFKDALKEAWDARFDS